MFGLSPQIENLVIILGTMQIAKKIPFDDPNVLNMCRALYIVSNLIIAGLYLWVQLKVNKQKGMFKSAFAAHIHAKPAPLNGTADIQSTDMTTLKYVEPAPMGSTEEPKLVTTTINAYDSAQVKTSFRSQLMGVAMMAGMHLYMKYTNPLIIQSIIPLKTALESNIVKIHVLGHPASGDLKRPFKAAAGLMGGLQQQGPPQSDKKAVEAAERAGRGGAKEE
ncbi:phosphate transporter [Apiospora saccharicola]|uniref:Phosphate transporter n=1 Tax=Apiospora saccharicola TaxID=335842 RepID=A0ABR1W4R2_9PEZI